MQHTLIIYSERKKLRQEYYIRVIIVACFMISLSGIIGIVSLFPAYIRSQYERSIEEKALAAVNSVKKTNSVTQTVDLKSGRVFLSTLRSNLETVRLSSFITSIGSARGVLTLTSFSLSRNGTSSAAIAIQGIAPTRESLLNFKYQLESMSPGTKVDLPVSELARSKDIPFSMQFVQTIK